MSTYVNKTEGLTGADIAAITRKAGLNAIKRYYKGNESKTDLIITKEDFDVALKSVAKHIVFENVEPGKSKKVIPVKKRE